MPRHFLDLDGARVLPTTGLQLVARAVGDVVDVAAMGVIHGPAGLGKTFAVEAALEAILHTDHHVGHAGDHAGAAGRDRERLHRRSPGLVWTSFTSRPTMRQVAKALYEQQTGSTAGGRSRFVLMDAVLEDLAARPRLVVIDEAQRLNTECFEFLRHLHDHPETRFPLLLVGGDGTWQVISGQPMLRSRIHRRIQLEALTPTQVRELIPEFHPVYAGVDPALITRVDDHLAHGNLRDWASFTLTASKLCAETGQAVIDERIVANAFTLHGGTG